MNTQTLKRIENNTDYIYVATDQDGNHIAAIAANFHPDTVADNVGDWLRKGYNVDRVKRNEFRAGKQVMWIIEEK